MKGSDAVRSEDTREKEFCEVFFKNVSMYKERWFLIGAVIGRKNWEQVPGEMSGDEMDHRGPP